MDLLTVPVVDTHMEARPMTLEEMEDVGKRYRERKRQCKVSLTTGEGSGQIWLYLHHLLAEETLGSGLFKFLFPHLYNKNSTYLTRFL